MSKLHAQMALFGAIDELVSKTNNLDTVATVEAFLPGTTGLGQRGWFGELKRFLSKPDLQPRGTVDNSNPRSGPVTFPDVRTALAELAEQPPSHATPPSPAVAPEPIAPEDTSTPPPDAMTPAVKAGALYASTILSKIFEQARPDGPGLPGIPGGPGLPEIDFSEPLPDPLQELLPRLLRANPPIDAIPSIDFIPAGTDRQIALHAEFIKVQNRAEYKVLVEKLAGAGVIDPDVAQNPIVCTGALRKIDGQFCSLLTTDWDRDDLTIEEMKAVIDPHNWPTLCPDFFVGMNDQTPLLSRGWTRVLEIVSGDRTQWELRTALRYWKGETTPDGGIYINYDLDSNRTGDCNMVEVDAGYIMITPKTPGNPASGVRIRTCKQVRIRGVSPTATAALGCFMRWGDAASHMLTDQAKNPPAGVISFGKLSTDPGAEPHTAQASTRPGGGSKQASEEATAEAAEKVELVAGWRGALIDNMQKEVGAFIDVAGSLASDLYRRWSDGMTVNDVKAFGGRFGTEMTNYTVNMMNAAADAIHPGSGTGAGTEGTDQ